MISRIGSRILSRSKSTSSTFLNIPSCSYSTDNHLEGVEVILSQIPNSATHSDIRNLCFKNPLYRQRVSIDNQDVENQGDASTPSQGTINLTDGKFENIHRVSVLRSILSIRFIRSAFFNETGKVSVKLNTYNYARQFVALCNGGILGGSKIHAKLDDTSRSSTSSSEQNSTKLIPKNLRILHAMQQASPGKTVLLKGLPEHMYVDRLTKLIGTNYGLAIDQAILEEISERGEKIRKFPLGPIVQIRNLTPMEFTSSFLVRFKNASDAMRLVRRWHRVPWFRSSNYQRMILDRHAQKSNEPAEQSSRNHDLNEMEEGLEEGEELEEEIEGNQFRGHEEKKFKMPLIIDARIMY